MRVLLLGAYGLIGAAALGRLLASGHAVTALGREVSAPARRWPEARWIARDIAALRDPADWAPLLRDADAVVNCAGALQDGLRDDLAAVHDQAMRALWRACAERPDGPPRVVQVSAPGAAPDAATAFLRTKGAADAALAASGLDWVVLRPGLVLGPRAYGGSAMLRAVAALPLVLPVARAGAPIRTVHVEDVAAAILAAAEGRVPARAAYDVMEARSHSLEALLRALRAWQGWPAPLLAPRLPDPLARLLFRAGDALGRLGWRSPVRSAAWAELARGVTGDPGPWIAAGGPAPRGLAQTLRDLPATVQERWFARLWLLKPAVIGGLAAVWIVTGLIGLARFGAAQAVLTDRGLGAGAAALAVAAGSVLDIGLGAAVLVRRWVAPAALGIVAVTLAYLLGGTVLAPDLWLDPLGPLVKAVPILLLALVAAALAPER